MGGVFGPGVEPSCGDTGAGNGDDTVDASVVGAPTTGATLARVLRPGNPVPVPG